VVVDESELRSLALRSSLIATFFFSYCVDAVLADE